MISIEGLDELGDKKINANEDHRSSILSTGRESGSYTSRSSSNQMHALPIQFHLKSLLPGNIIVPSLYLLLQAFSVISMIEVMVHIKNDELLD